MSDKHRRLNPNRMMSCKLGSLFSILSCPIGLLWLNSPDAKVLQLAFYNAKNYVDFKVEAASIIFDKSLSVFSQWSVQL